ncbi:Cyclin-dependent kinase 20 [Mortierella sp. AD032]|nr:Cyclin-dependent kinase 20 [Mortierella sp. AD032]
MHLLNTVQLLHENPYTGDRINKARIVRLEPSLLRDTIKAQQQQQPQGNASNGTDEDALPALGIEQDTSNINELGTVSRRQRGHELVAIKFLSSSVSYDDGFDSSSDEDDEDHADNTTTTQKPLASGWTAIGQSDIPQKVKFSIKAKREIAALKAAQGHPNVVPFLGFTGHKHANPIHKPSRQEQEESSPAHLSVSTAPSLGGSLFGSALPLGRSLFQQDLDRPLPSVSSITFLQPSTSILLDDGPQNLITPFLRRTSRFDSDDGDDSDDSDDNNAPHELDPNSSAEAKAHYYHRIFSRQPGPGGIILPLVHNSLQDLIRIGWTRTRPLMAETCMRQILEGLAWIHDEAGLIHRDISAGNILVAIAPGGYRDELLDAVQDRKDGKGRGFIQCLISDFGCATFQSASETTTTMADDANQHDGEVAESETVEESDYRHHYYRPELRHQQGLTFEVGTRAYRAPELLFSSGTYTNAIDIWSAGVLFAELYLGKHLFEAESDIGQVCAIVKVLGTPTDDNWPEYKSMPDYGKLIFQALETNDLGSILLGSSSSASSPKTTTNKEKNTSDSLNTDDDSARDEQREERKEEELTPPPTLISEGSFRLIERLVTFSGPQRPSARQALSDLPSLDENGELAEDSEERGRLSQCILDVQQVLDELKRLREREADESEDDDREGGEGGRLFMFGGDGYGRNAEMGDESDDDDGEKSFRSDDFSRYELHSGAGGHLGNGQGQEQGEGQDRQFERVFDGHNGYEPVSVSEHGGGEVAVNGGGGGGGGEGEEIDGPLRAVKRHRGVSSGSDVE